MGVNDQPGGLFPLESGGSQTAGSWSLGVGTSGKHCHPTRGQEPTRSPFLAASWGRDQMWNPRTKTDLCFQFIQMEKLRPGEMARASTTDSWGQAGLSRPGAAFRLPRPLAFRDHVFFLFPLSPAANPHAACCLCPVLAELEVDRGGLLSSQGE